MKKVSDRRVEKSARKTETTRTEMTDTKVSTSLPMISSVTLQACRRCLRIAATVLVIVNAIGFVTSQVPAAEPDSTSRQGSAGARASRTDGSNSAHAIDMKSVANSSKVIRYAQNRIAKYDMNRDGVLQVDEWKAMKGNPEQIDSDKDGVITQDELAAWIATYQQRKSSLKSSADPVAVQPNTAEAQFGPATKPEPLSQSNIDSISNEADSPLTSQPKRQRDQRFYVSPKRLPEGLPEWFLARDKDGDGQLTEAEFSTSGSSQELAEFKGFDANGDGVVTAKECTGKTREKKSGAAAKPTSDGLPSANPDAAPKGRRKTKSAR